VRTTRHMDQRMNQRAMNKAMIDAVHSYGEPVGDKVLLDRKACDVTIAKLRRELAAVTKIRDKGGVAIVEVGDDLLTAYRVDSFDRKAGSRGTH
jgi:hypothetical protein